MRPQKHPFARRLPLVPAIGFGAALAASGAVADTFTITTDTAVTNGGFTVDGNDTLTVNSGVTVGVAGASNGLETTGGSNTIVNNGTITAVTGSGINANGGTFYNVTNNGTITVTGAGGTGLTQTGNFGTFANSGTITASGAGATGMLFNGAGETLTNSGTIRAEGAGGIGVHFTAATQDLTNTGQIISDDLAIRADGAEVGLNLHTSGFVQGGIQISTSTFIVIDATGGQSSFYTFTGSNWFSAQVLGDVPYVIDATNQTIATVDPTGILSQNSGLQDFGAGLDGLLGNDGGSGVQVTKLAAPLERPPLIEPVRSTRWVGGAALGSTYGARGSALAYNRAQGLLAAGVERPTGFGIAAGVAKAYMSADATFARSQAISTDTLFAAAYSNRDLGHARLNLSLSAGWQQNDSRRWVNSILAGGGKEIARATYGSWFARAAVRASRRVSLGQRSWLTASGDLSAALLRVSGYAETGSSANLTANARTVRHGQGAVQVTLGHSFGLTNVQGTLGLGATTGFGGATLSGTLAGSAVSYDPGSAADWSGGFLGFSVDRPFSDKARLTLSARGDYDGSGLARASGSIDFRLQF